MKQTLVNSEMFLMATYQEQSYQEQFCPRISLHLRVQKLAKTPQASFFLNSETSKSNVEFFRLHILKRMKRVNRIRNCEG